MNKEEKNFLTLDYPPLTEDIDEAKSHLDKYGMALIANALSDEEVMEMDVRPVSYTHLRAHETS